MMSMVIILTSCSFWAILSIFNGWNVRKFIFSKPPGRKMITADINAIGFIFTNVMPLVISFGVSLRTGFGHFPFFGVFLLTEATTIPFSLNLGVYNVAAIFHVILIFYPRSVFFVSFLYLIFNGLGERYEYFFSVGEYYIIINLKIKVMPTRLCSKYKYIIVIIL